MDEEIYVLCDEEGNEIEHQYLNDIEYNGQTYAVLTPVVEEEAEDIEIIFLKVVPDPENPGDEMLVAVDDDEELDAVYDEFARLMEEYEASEE